MLLEEPRLERVPVPALFRMSSHLIRERAGTPPYLQPYLHALDRMQKREHLRPDQLVARARALLNDRLGGVEGVPDAAFAHGGTGLLGEHTHYFDGFSLLLLLPLGTAVAVRTTTAETSRVVFEGSDATWTFDRNTPARPGAPGPRCPVWARLVEHIVRQLGAPQTQLEIGVAGTVNPGCTDAYLAALGVATARSLQALFALPVDTARLHDTVREAVQASTQMPFSLPFVLAADAGRADVYALGDARTREQMLLDAPARDLLGWALVDVGTGPLHEAAFFRKRQEMTDEAVDLLRRKLFPTLTSLRDVEHRDLPRALDALPRRLRPIVRHLVTENRRVQKMVTSIRQRDWQMFGALLLMSHASLRTDWGSTHEELDVVVEQVEQMSIEGMYGACMTGRGGCVLLMGQPFIVPRCLDRIGATLQERFHITPDVILL